MICTTEQVNRFADEPVDGNDWTAIIPVAGRGSRLGSDLPKVLFQLAGRSLLSYLAELLVPRVTKVVLVCSPSGIDAIRIAAAALFPNVSCVLQNEPTGMADAVLCAQDQVRTPFALVIWGDQILIRPQTLRTAMSAHKTFDAPLTLPTLIRRDPYIHFERDQNGKIVRVLQKREGEISRDEGENDGGLFFFNRADLFQVLHEGKKKNLARGLETGEFNLLQLIPKFEDVRSGICTLRILSDAETLGINTPDDARRVAAVLESSPQIGRSKYL